MVFGCSLQWLALSVLVVEGTIGSSLQVQLRLAVLLFGIAATLVGIILACRGNSLGPIIVIPAIIGIGILLILTAVTYPLRFFVKSDGDAVRGPDP